LFRGDVNVAGRDLINNVKIIHQRALTAAEAAEKARAIEIKLLAEGIGKYANDLKNRLAEKDESHTPYRGLLEYRLTDAKRFFGRDTAKVEIAQLISRSAFSVLHAESGAGKTSLLQAGIMPAILASPHLPMYVRSYDKNPADVIKRTLLADSEFAAGLMKERLADFLRRVTSILSDETTLILILDQFEEFFTRAQEADRKSFIDELAECVNNPSLNVRWLLCLRKEYFSDLTAFRPGISDPFENAYQLKPLSRAEAEDAIAKPARLQKITFEKELIPGLLNDLGEEQILPPHIQLVGSALFENLDPKQKTFTRADYLKLGKAQGILKNHLDRVLSEKVPKNRIAVCQQVLQGLVTSTQQRVLRTEQDLFTALENYPEDQVRDAISLLARNRLLRGEETESGVAYELAHDILLDEIKLNPEIVKRKQAEELLEQGVRNLKHFGVLLNSDILAVIGRQKDGLHFTTDQVCMLLLSLVDAKKRNRDWQFYLSKARQENRIGEISKILNALLSHSNQRVSNNAKYVLWNFLSDSPVNAKSKIILWNLGRRLPTLLKQALTISVTALLAYNLAWVVSRDQLERLGWQRAASLSPDCVAETPSEIPFISADPLNSSRIVSYGKSQAFICQSLDAGDTWESMSAGLPPNTSIKSIALRKDLSLLISATELFLWDDQAKGWESANIDFESSKEILSLSIGRKDGTIFIGLLPHEIVSIQTKGICNDNIELPECQNNVNTSDLSGEINFLETNEKYIVVNTSKGTWFSAINEINWETHIGLDQPISSFFLQTQSFLNNKVFVVVFAKEKIKRGEMGIESLSIENVWPFPSTNGDEVWDWPEGTIYTTESDYVYYASTINGIQRYPSWSIFDHEWWRLIPKRFSSK